MKLTRVLTIAAASGVLAAGASAAEYNVTRTLQLEQPMADVWRHVGGFCDIDDWHPEVADCEVTATGGKLRRTLTTRAGDRFVDTRIARETGLSYTYSASETPLAVNNFIATLSIEPIDGARLSWSASFSADDPETEARVIAMIEAGLSGIDAAFAR